MRFGIVYNGEFLDTIKKSINYHPSVYGTTEIHAGAVDPSITPVAAPKDSIYIRDGSNFVTVWIKRDDGLSTNWKPISGGSTGGSGDVSIVNTEVTVTQQMYDDGFLSLTDEPYNGLVTVDVLGGIRQQSTVDYAVTSNILSWGGRGLEEIIEVGTVLFLKYQIVIPFPEIVFNAFDILITSDMVATKTLFLPSAPSTNLEVVPIGGIPQRNGYDFSVNGNVLQWEGLGLEEILEIGDYVNVSYVSQV